MATLSLSEPSGLEDKTFINENKRFINTSSGIRKLEDLKLLILLVNIKEFISVVKRLEAEPANLEFSDVHLQEYHSNEL